jgi:hypothetical protein
MSCPRALYIQDILNRCPFKPREFLVVEEILVTTYEHPHSERRDIRYLTPQKNLSKLSGTFHVDAPQSFEFAEVQEASVHLSQPERRRAQAKISPLRSMISHVHEVWAPLLRRRRNGKDLRSK